MGGAGAGPRLGGEARGGASVSAGAVGGATSELRWEGGRLKGGCGFSAGSVRQRLSAALLRELYKRALTCLPSDCQLQTRQQPRPGGPVAWGVTLCTRRLRVRPPVGASTGVT